MVNGCQGQNTLGINMGRRCCACAVGDSTVAVLLVLDSFKPQAVNSVFLPPPPPSPHGASGGMGVSFFSYHQLGLEHRIYCAP